MPKANEIDCTYYPTPPKPGRNPVEVNQTFELPAEPIAEPATPLDAGDAPAAEPDPEPVAEPARKKGNAK